jgi:hypothetical protein
MAESFINDYLQWTSGNECPTLFHRWGALAAISNFVSGRVWVDQGIFPVHANMYLIFVGDPGSKKSTAMGLSFKLIEHFKNIVYAPTAITKEAIMVMMAGENSPCKMQFKHEDKPVFFTHLSVYASELVNLLNSGGNPIGMIDFFTDVWDRVHKQYRDTTKNKGDNLIVRPYITITGCMTGATARSMMNQKLISSGMTRRCLFIHANRASKPIARPQVTEEQSEALQRLLKYAVKLQNVSGVFAWTPEAEQYFDNWYANVHFPLTHTETSTILKEFYQTKPEYVLKVSMLLWLSERTDSLVITAENLEKSIKWITEVERGGQLLFENAGRNQLAAVGQAIVAYLTSKPSKTATMKDIRETFQREVTFDELDKIMGELSLIQKLKTGVRFGSKPDEYVMLYDAFLAKAAADKAKRLGTGPMPPVSPAAVPPAAVT